MQRDPSHFETLLELLGLEEKAEAARFREAREGKTAEELAARGLVLTDLEAVDEGWGLGGRLIVTLARKDASQLLGKWEPGAVVLVTPARAELTPVRGVVARRERTRLHVAFDDVPPPFVTSGNVLVFASYDERGFLRAKNAVHAVLAMDRGAAATTRDILLARTPPRSFGDTNRNSTASVESSGREFRFVSPKLNLEQVGAVEKAMAARDFFLVHGPPGTGKSTVLAEVAARAIADGRTVLLTAASNAAVDHLLELAIARGLRGVRIGHPARVADELVEHTLDEQVRDEAEWQLAQELWDEAAELSGYARRQRQQGRSKERFGKARQAAGEAKSLRKEAREREARAVKAVLERAQVIAATLSGLWTYEMQARRFDLALIDEATQAIEPLALSAFLRATTVVLAGDHCQLPPTVLSQAAAARGLSVSLFERLLADHGDAVRLMLKEQHRMSQEIMDFPSRETYGGELRAHPGNAARRLEVLAPDVGGEAQPVPPVVFLDTAGRGFEDEIAPGTESYRNPGEAALVIERAVVLARAGLSPRQMAIIAPYSAQATELRAQAADHAELAELEIDTVDAFQGREKEAVLVSLTRSNAESAIGFLRDLRRMNVAITRARAHLFVVGDSATVSQHDYYRRFIEQAQARGWYRSVWEWPTEASRT